MASGRGHVDVPADCSEGVLNVARRATGQERYYVGNGEEDGQETAVSWGAVTRDPVSG